MKKGHLVWDFGKDSGSHRTSNGSQLLLIQHRGALGSLLFSQTFQGAGGKRGGGLCLLSFIASAPFSEAEKMSIAFT